MRNHSIDTLKFVCAVLVVFLHVDTPYRFLYLPITRCAVPVFFMISGYLLMGEKMEERMIRGIKRVIMLILWSSALYAIINIVKFHGDISCLFLTKKQLFYFLVYNENPWGFHLWYLGAYLYVLLIGVFIEKCRLWKKAFMLIPFLLLVDLAFGKYSLLLMGREYPYIYVRNFLFVGLPYFLLGCFLKLYWRGKGEKRHFLLVCGVVLFSITSLLENGILVHLGLDATRDHYISTTLLAVCLFLCYESVQKQFPSKITTLGNRDSLFIYIYHPIVMLLFFVINHFLPSFWTDTIYPYIAPIIIIFTTICLISFVRLLKTSTMRLVINK